MTLDVENPHVHSVAEQLAAHPFVGWFYGDSIGFEGLLAASDLTGDARWQAFAHGFCRGWAARASQRREDDNTAPGLVMCELIETTHDQVLKEAVLTLAGDLCKRRRVNGTSITFEDTLRSLREPYGGIALDADQKHLMRNPGAGIYVDCMHFDAPFFARLSHLDVEGGWAELAVDEIRGYRSLLFDETLGLYRHFWLERTSSAYTNGWGRGQGWALLGLLDVAIALETHSSIAPVVAQAQQLARTMLDYQLDDGNWHCLVHESRSGPESSTAAFMATAFYRGMLAGLLPRHDFEEPAMRAFQAMRVNLDSTGKLRGVSAAVMSALVEEHYWHVPLDKNVPWGQGPVLTAMEAKAAFDSHIQAVA